MVSVALHGEDPEYLSEVALDAESLLKGLEDATEVQRGMYALLRVRF